MQPRLQVTVAQKQVLTPGLVQLVAVLQLNRLELRELIAQEVAQNPVLEDSADLAEEITPEELRQVFEQERTEAPADQELLAATGTKAQAEAETYGEAEGYGEAGGEYGAGAYGVGEYAAGEYGGTGERPGQEGAGSGAELPGEGGVAGNGSEAGSGVEGTLEGGAAESKTTDPFDEIDFDSYFQEYLEPGFKSPAGENPEKASWETFYSTPLTLPDHLRQQLSLVVIPEEIRDAADTIIGNLDENGYLMTTLEEIATYGNHELEVMEKALEEIQVLDPAGVGARDIRECLLLQMEARGGEGGVAWQILDKHMKLLETRQFKELAKVMGRPLEHIQVAVEVIRHLDPRPGLKYSGPGARAIEPDVTIFKNGDAYLIELHDDDLPQLGFNRQYLRLLDKSQEPDKEVRNYIRERYQSASMLLRNIEQRKQTILKVCQTVVERQREFLDEGLEKLRPMMIKDVAELIGVHPSTVSRAVSGKFVHTPQGVYELRFFFGEATQGASGSSTPLVLLKRMVKKIISEEDPAKPLTDEQIMAKLKEEGFDVTRRTVAKYREDLNIPSTHHRRVRE